MVYIDVPAQIKQLKIQHRQDSLKATIYAHKIDSLAIIMSESRRWIDQDYLSLQKIKSKLHIK
jgi:hypothetical protein